MSAAFDPKAFVSGAAEGGTVATYRPREVIFSQGSPADAVFYVLTGRVKRTVASYQGKEAVVALLGPGEFFGEGCLSGKTHRISSAIAVEECTIARLEKSVLARVLHEQATVADMFIADLLKHNQRTEADLADQLFNFGASRLIFPTIPDLLRVIDAIPDAIVITDVDGLIRFINPAAEKLFGYSRDQLIGECVDILVPKKDRDAHKVHREAYIANPEQRSMGNGMEFDAVRADGTLFPVGVSLGYADTQSRRVVIATIQDQTERHQREKMKEEFVATVSHELRSPLTSIMGSIALVTAGAAGILPDSAAGLLKIASANCKRLLSLINEILDFAKLESGEMEFDMKRVAVCPLISQQIKAIEGSAELCGVSFQFDCGDEDSAVLADAGRLAQAVDNLLSNAIKYSPRGSEVVVAVENRDDMICITVRDHGQGIPVEFTDRIFEKFTQVDASDARQRGGTGLGLSIVKNIVERLHGQVGFEPAPGGGTIFYIMLPRWQQP